MSLISESIMMDFSEWAVENEDKSAFSEISKESTSYYINRNVEETYMMEYSVETMEELKKALEKYIGLSEDSPMLRTLTVGILQNRFRSQLKVQDSGEQSKTKDSSKDLPDFVYVF